MKMTDHNKVGGLMLAPKSSHDSEIAFGANASTSGGGAQCQSSITSTETYNVSRHGRPDTATPINVAARWEGIETRMSSVVRISHTDLLIAETRLQLVVFAHSVT